MIFHGEWISDAKLLKYHPLQLIRFFSFSLLKILKNREFQETFTLNRSEKTKESYSGNRIPTQTTLVQNHERSQTFRFQRWYQRHKVLVTAVVIRDTALPPPPSNHHTRRYTELKRRGFQGFRRRARSKSKGAEIWKRLDRSFSSHSPQIVRAFPRSPAASGGRELFSQEW